MPVPSPHLATNATNATNATSIWLAGKYWRIFSLLFFMILRKFLVAPDFGMFADTIKDTRQGRSAAGKETKGPTIL
jgi:hypothetical protein